MSYRRANKSESPSEQPEPRTKPRGKSNRQTPANPLPQQTQPVPESAVSSSLNTSVKSLTIPELESRQLALEAEITAVKAEGVCWQGYWIDSSRRGTKVYYRLRWYRGRDEQGKESPPGYRSLNTPQALAEARGAIERGKRLGVLEKELEEVAAELARKRQIGRELGLL